MALRFSRTTVTCGGGGSAAADDDYMPSDRRPVSKPKPSASARAAPAAAPAGGAGAGRPDFGAGGSLGGGDEGLAEGEAAVYDWATLQDTGPSGAIRY